MSKVLAISDTHTGSRLGLTPPEWWPPDTGAVLKAMWDWYTATLKAIGRVDLAVHLGDAVDGEGKREDLEQLVTDTKKQAEINVQVLEAVPTKRWRFCYGTSFHVLGTYNYEEPIAEAFGASIRDTQLLELHGHRFSFRHLVGRGGTPYSQQTLLMKEAVREQLMAELEERDAPDVVVRGHVHYYAEAGNSQRIARVCPCFQVPASAFGRGCRPFFYDIGLLEIEVTKRGVDIRPHIMPLKIVARRDYERVF